MNEALITILSSPVNYLATIGLLVVITVLFNTVIMAIGKYICKNPWCWVPKKQGSGAGDQGSAAGKLN